MAEVNVTPELRFPEFDGICVRKKLGKVLNITSSARVLKDEWTENGVPFFRSSDVVADFKGENNKKAYISIELYNSLSKKIGRVKKDDILITGGGSIGIPFLIKNNDPLYFKDADLLWIKINERVNGYFLYSFFLTQSFRKYIQSISHVGTIAHYTVVQAKNTPCYFPSPEEQQKIASFLTAVDERIQLLQNKKAKLEAYKKGVMQQLFSQEIRFKDENGNDFPDWEEKKLGEMLQLRNGYAFKSTRYTEKGQFKIITISNVQDGELDVEECKKINVLPNDLKGHQILKEGDLLVSLTGNVGRIAIVDQENCLLNQRVGKLEIDGKLRSFLFQLLRRGHFLNRMVSLAQGGAQPNLSKGDIDNYQIALPTEEERNRITSFLDSIDNAIKLVSDEAHKTVLYKVGLLQKMFV